MRMHTKPSPLSRRAFLKTAATSVAALSTRIPVRAAEPKPSSSDKLILSAPITHCDWMLKDNRPDVKWGPDGVRHMLSICKAAGISQVYWRVLDAGRAMYKSRLVLPGENYEFNEFYNPLTKEEKALLDSFHMDYQRRGHSNRLISEMINSMDYTTFDSFAAAVEIGHELGLKIHAWVTINEDDHGWGAPSAFSRLWPEFRWVRRDGRPFHSQLSFAFPKVMEYKLGIIKELLQYDLDGLFIDWLRTGDVRDNPQTDANGVADYGYEAPVVESFKRKYRIDPHELPNDDMRWVRWRAESRTEFMRRARKLCRSHRKHLPISVLVANPWCYRGLGDKISGDLKGLLVDTKTWAREGLIDAASPAGYFKGGGSTEEACRALQKETEGRIEIWPYEWVPKNPAEFAAQAARAKSVSANQILFWEGDYLDDPEPAAREALAKAMSAQAAGSR
jgi:uncharacterized lipoprotein YddW (UPF0748 family)